MTRWHSCTLTAAVRLLVPEEKTTMSQLFVEMLTIGGVAESRFDGLDKGIPELT